MCFAPQRRAIFRHQTFKKWPESVVFSTFWLTNVLRATSRVAFLEHLNVQNGSGIVVFCAFWLANVLRATAAWHFGTSERPKWVRECGVCAFWLANVLRAHSRVPFSPVRGTATSAPAALASLLFEHQEPRFIEKTQRFATSLTFFAHVPSF